MKVVSHVWPGRGGEVANTSDLRGAKRPHLHTGNPSAVCPAVSNCQHPVGTWDLPFSLLASCGLRQIA